MTASTGDGSTADRLALAATAIRAAFFLFVVAFALVPVAGVLAGVAPFAAPESTPYLALVAATLVGTAALVAAALLNV